MKLMLPHPNGILTIKGQRVLFWISAILVVIFGISLLSILTTFLQADLADSFIEELGVSIIVVSLFAASWICLDFSRSSIRLHDKTLTIRRGILLFRKKSSIRLDDVVSLTIKDTSYTHQLILSTPTSLAVVDIDLYRPPYINQLLVSLQGLIQNPAISKDSSIQELIRSLQSDQFKNKHARTWLIVPFVWLGAFCLIVVTYTVTGVRDSEVACEKLDREGKEAPAHVTSVDLRRRLYRTRTVSVSTIEQATQIKMAVEFTTDKGPASQSILVLYREPIRGTHQQLEDLYREFERDSTLTVRYLPSDPKQVRPASEFPHADKKLCHL